MSSALIREARLLRPRAIRAGGRIGNKWQVEEGSVLKLHPQILVKDGNKQFAVLPYEEFVSLKERLEEMEALLELRKAKKAEGRKRSVPLSLVQRELGLQ